MGVVQRGSNGRAIRAAETVERDAKAWALRVGRATYAAIGRELGVTTEAARQSVQRHARSLASEELAEVKQQVLAELDVFERELLDVIGRPHYVVTKDGDLVRGPDGEYLIDDAPIVAAISAALRVITERARLLGLYAPTRAVQRLEVITRDAFIEHLEALEAEVAALESGESGG